MVIGSVAETEVVWESGCTVATRATALAALSCFCHGAGHEENPGIRGFP